MDMLAAQAQTATAQMAAGAPPAFLTAKTVSPEKAQEVGKKFEAMFLSQMLQHMFTGIDAENGLFGGGHAEAMFRPMLIDEYAKMISNRAGGIGLADKVATALLKHQEV